MRVLIWPVILQSPPKGNRQSAGIRDALRGRLTDSFREVRSEAAENSSAAVLLASIFRSGVMAPA